jgi:hypothetical protein
MARQPHTELRLLPGLLAAAILDGRAFLLASTELLLHPGPGRQRLQR